MTKYFSWQTLTSQINNATSKIVREHPQRFSGFAILNIGNPVSSARELERSAKELNLKGALLYSDVLLGKYLDGAEF